MEKQTWWATEAMKASVRADPKENQAEWEEQQKALKIASKDAYFRWLKSMRWNARKIVQEKGYVTAQNMKDFAELENRHPPKVYAHVAYHSLFDNRHWKAIGKEYLKETNTYCNQWAPKDG